MKKRIQDLKNFLSHPTGRATAWVYSSQLQGAITGFIVNVVLMRVLPKDQYGLFSLFVATMMMLAGFMNMGWNETYVRFASEHQSSQHIHSIKYWFFKRTLACALGVAGIAILARTWVASHLLSRPDFSYSIIWSCIGAITLTLSTFLIAGFQSQQNFKSYFKLQTAQSVARVTFVCGVCFYLGSQTPIQFLMASYALIPAMVLVMAWPKKAPPVNLIPAELREQMSGYQRWFIVSLVANTLIGNIDSWILAHYHPNESLAAFGAAGRLAMPVQMLATSLTTALLPRLANSDRQDLEIKLYLAKLRRWLPLLVIVLGVMTWLLPSLLAKIAGHQYADAVILIRWLMICTIVVMITNPVSLPLLVWGKTKWLAIINLIQLILDIALDLLWIPRMGALGAIWATLAIYLFSMVTIFTLVRWELRKRSRSTV